MFVRGEKMFCFNCPNRHGYEGPVTIDNADVELHDKGIKVRFVDRTGFESATLNLLNRSLFVGLEKDAAITKLQRRIVAYSIAKNAIEAMAHCSRPDANNHCRAFERSLAIDTARDAIEEITHIRRKVN